MFWRFCRLRDSIPIASETSATARYRADGFDSGSPFISELRSLSIFNCHQLPKVRAVFDFGSVSKTNV